MIEIGKPAPNFILTGDDNQIYSLIDFVGQPIILFFYPKDDTPGCTKEACAFRDYMPLLKTEESLIFGVSKDSIASHMRFKNKYNLNFPLLSDPELKVHESYQVLENGRTIRSTFLVDHKGNLAKIWSPVKVPGHAEEVLDAIKQLSKK